MKHPTERFSNRVEDYVRYRPTYPQAILPFLEQTCQLRADCAIADIGSGTGLLTQLFLNYGSPVYAVEPNAAMRGAAEQRLNSHSGFTSLAGRAEEIPLAADSVDFITAGQAFHWFEPALARREFERILKPGGWVVLVWNQRLETTPLQRAYGKMLLAHAPDYAAVNHRNFSGIESLSNFLKPGAFELAEFENVQHFDFAGLKGRLMSSSYAPTPDQAAHTPLMQALQQLFDQHAESGRVQFDYVTQLYYAQIS
ncbi:class I SAM-dependent methyltransferase [Romeria aff. gracilis LEGE 07310]|uniref:Class I SAM-dependent methyltransferase n=1 Tax=Vasconcelosia minhoensis LEGE 07310 TaxID=915328 RepID=A0A8J7ATG8_9CYAN|nr:class I SAM-dependent methyltransferase [Romeria gracilis]MBE9076203.1 class I SAM-dependent methyltransferase [Romeria aff. gracilis LEGE 07310]